MDSIRTILNRILRQRGESFPEWQIDIHVEAAEEYASQFQSLSSEAEKGECCYDAEDYRKYQVPFGPSRCPVCGGNGIVDNGFYGQTSGTWVSAGGTEPCRSCNGSGVLWPVNPYSPSPPTAQEKQGVEDENELQALAWMRHQAGALGYKEWSTATPFWLARFLADYIAPAAPDKGEEKHTETEAEFNARYKGRSPFAEHINNEKLMNARSVEKSEGEEAMTEQKFLEKWATDSDYHNGCPDMKKDLQSLYSSLIHSSGDRGRKEWPSEEEIRNAVLYGMGYVCGKHNIDIPEDERTGIANKLAASEIKRLKS